jgi:hypothetical protein
VLKILFYLVHYSLPVEDTLTINSHFSDALILGNARVKFK